MRFTARAKAKKRRAPLAPGYVVRCIALSFLAAVVIFIAATGVIDTEPVG